MSLSSDIESTSPQTRLSKLLLNLLQKRYLHSPLLFLLVVAVGIDGWLTFVFLCFVLQFKVSYETSAIITNGCVHSSVLFLFYFLCLYILWLVYLHDFCRVAVYCFCMRTLNPQMVLECQ